jgi:hypothetical protein
MKSAQITSGREVRASAGWLLGVNSVRNPWALPDNQIKWAVNCSVRGGVVQTRPGYSMRLSLPPGNFQGGILFSSNKQSNASEPIVQNGITKVVPAQIFNPDGTSVVADEIPYVVFAVNGSVYYSPFPLTQPKSWEDFRLKNIQLDPSVDQFVFTLATQTAQVSTGGDVTVTPSHRIVVIQDGISAPAYWDGSNQTGIQTTSIPTGYWMAFSGNRLWVSAKNIVLASDLGDPTSFTERLTGTGRGDFAFARVVTGMTNYIGQNNDTKLIVFTDRATYSLASGIYDRTQWASTANFQTTLYPTIGCVAGKSISFQAGQIWWYSQGGLISADIAASAYITSQSLYRDVEMARVKAYMAGDTSKICAMTFENYLLYSVPYLEPCNAATMVLDYAPAAEWGTQKIPAWCGVWTGTRPVEWISGVINGAPRCFHFSVDYSATNDGSYNHLWEAFTERRADTYFDIDPDGGIIEKVNRIYCQMETALLGDGLDFKQFQYGEIEACEIGGTVDVKASYRGSKGTYQNILETKILAVTDDYQWVNTDLSDEIESLGFLNTQYRRLITESTSRTASSITCESKLTNDIDKAFSMLIEWCGEFGVESLRIFLDPWSERSTGVPNSPEVKSCVISQDGTSLTVDLLPSPYEQAETSQKSWWAKEYRTVSLTCTANPSKSISATASASFLSSISQIDAKTQAGILAENAASNAAKQYLAQNPC